MTAFYGGIVTKNVIIELVTRVMDGSNNTKVTWNITKVQQYSTIIIIEEFELYMIN